VVDERDELMSLARSFNEHPGPANGAAVPGAAGQRPGDDFEARASWREVLEPAGWELVFERGDVGYWRRPGKDGRSWSATTGRCKGEDGRSLLYVFTTSAPPFESERTYSRFAAFALLNHQGDYRAAARALAARGYGTQQRKAAPPVEANGHPRGDAYEGLDPVSAEAGRAGDIFDLVIPPASGKWPAPIAAAAYHGLAGEVVRRVEPYTEADPVAILVQFLVGFGNAAGRLVHCVVGQRWHSGNLYAVLVGRTSQGGKGEAWGWVDALLKGACPEWYTESVVTGLSSGEGLITAVQEVREDTAGRRVLVVEEEFGRVLRVLAREYNTLSAVLRQGWDGGRLRVLTRQKPLQVEEALLSLIGHITPTELIELLATTDTANGFANRILWVMVRRSKLLPEGGHVDLADLQYHVRNSVEFAQTVRQIGRSAEARALWHDSYAGLRQERPGVLGMVTTRAAAQVLRLSLLYAMLDRSRQIEVVHLEAALAVWEYSVRSAACVFGESSGDLLADEIIDLLAAAENWVSQTELHHLVGKRQSAATLARALGILVSENLVESRQCPTKGRPILQWKTLAKRQKGN
jgi:hypothetical protein